MLRIWPDLAELRLGGCKSYSRTPAGCCTYNRCLTFLKSQGRPTFRAGRFSGGIAVDRLSSDELKAISSNLGTRSAVLERLREPDHDLHALYRLPFSSVQSSARLLEGAHRAVSSRDLQEWNRMGRHERADLVRSARCVSSNACYGLFPLDQPGSPLASGTGVRSSSFQFRE